MKKYLSFFVLFLLLLTSCDEGRIYEKEIVVPVEGLTLKLTGELEGIGDWPSKYSIVVAGFSADSEYASISKVVSASGDDGTKVETVLSGIKDNVDEVELCVINRLRRKVVTFQTIEKADFSTVNDTIYMEVGKLDVGMFTSIQNNIFTPSCASCHGSTGSAAKNLFLTEGRSYEALVNQPAHSDSEVLLVEPGNASGSFLHLVLNEEGHVAHSHLDILDAKRSTVLLTLLDDWINNGAKEN